MIKDQLKALFSQPYQRTAYLDFLKAKFKIELRPAPLEIESDQVDRFERLGKLFIDEKLANGRLHPHQYILLEIHVSAQTQLDRNRVQLRNLAAQQIDAAQGALAVYVDQEKAQWRLSWIKQDYKLDEKGILVKVESPPKRATFLLGQGMNIRTAVERFDQLPNRADHNKLHDLETVFSVESLNREFYRKLYNWYERASQSPAVIFPSDSNQPKAKHLIRLLTRLLFVWFLRQKDLINPALFDRAQLKNLIHYDRQPSSFYKAILQNLFFATLNRPIEDRKFSKQNSTNYGLTNLYRYQRYFKSEDPAQIIALFEQTPFLNGGLFDCLDRDRKADEPSTTPRQENTKLRIDGFSDRADNVLNIPNALFFNPEESKLGLIDLLEQYQFTIAEAMPLDVDVALDPELLGKVFENLLASYNLDTAEQKRKATGSFYTPRTIVSFMVDESLKTYFKAKLDSESIDQLFQPDCTQNPCDQSQTQQLIQAIDDLKVLDPAVGSGAFPMAILQKLVELLQILDPQNQIYKQQQLAKVKAIPDDQSRTQAEQAIENVFTKANQYNDYGRKLFLIKNCLYGVDLQNIAIQICKLRFFIALAIEQTAAPDQPNHGLQPLPNLETRFIAADTLTQPAFNDQVLKSETLQALQNQLKDLRTQYFSENTVAGKRRHKQTDRKCRSQLKTELQKADMPDDIAHKLAAWDIYDQNAEADWFDPAYMFNLKGGFDLVIGNPPYIQLQKHGGRLARQYQAHGYTSFARSGDIYLLFYERACQLLKRGGLLTFITSNKWLRAAYGQKLRQYLLTHTRPQILLDLGPGIFESATVDTNILLTVNGVEDDFRKHYITDKNITRTLRALTLTAAFKTAHSSLQTYFKAHQFNVPFKLDKEKITASWLILNPTEQSIKTKIETSGTPLKDWKIQIYRGVLTGYNEAFIISTAQKDELLANCHDPAERHRTATLLKPILRGRDIKKYQAAWAGLWLIATHNGYKDEQDKPIRRIKIEAYPTLKKHLDQYSEQLKKRQDKGATPYNLRNCAYYPQFEKAKIVWSEMTKRNCFVWNDDGILVNQTCYFIPNANKYYLAILNSKATFWYFSKCLGADLGGGAFRWIKQYVENIPIPKLSVAEQQPFITLVDTILEGKAAGKDTTAEEQRIDDLVFDLYGLTEAEKAWIRQL